jgi:hypothetical protein
MFYDPFRWLNESFARPSLRGQDTTTAVVSTNGNAESDVRR